MSLTAYPTLRLKLTMPQALKLQFLPAVPGFNASQVANKVNRTGDTMSGQLLLAADPTFNLEAATKQYVDAHSGSGGGGAPTTAEYITSTSDATLTAERVLTDSATITWDRTTAGQIKANTAAGGGNISNSGTPALDQVGIWVSATTIKGIGGTANQVLRIGGAGTTPAFGAIDLSQAAAATGVLRAASFPTLTGDVTTAGGALATAITDNAVTYAKMQNASAASVLIGRGSAAGAGDPQEITLGTGLSMTGTVLAATGGADTSNFTPPQGRLTLQAAMAVMTTPQSAKTTIYYTPYVGNRIPIYDGTNMVMTTFTELSVATTDTTKNPAAIGASKINDWYVWNDAGTLRLSHDNDWTNDTTRLSGHFPQMVIGLWVNSVGITNGPAGGRGTYVGTTRSNASSQLDWIYGGMGAGGIAAFFGVWNAYNRVNIMTMVQETTVSWSYAVSDWRSVNASNNNRVSYVAGLQEDSVDASYSVNSQGAFNASVGIGVDTVLVASGAFGYSSTTVSSSPVTAQYRSISMIGYHFIQAIEWAAATSTFIGTSITSGDPYIQNGLLFSFRM